MAESVEKGTSDRYDGPTVSANEENCIYCPSCGTKAAADAKFCSACGGKL